jgi:hypothetical protein
MAGAGSSVWRISSATFLIAASLSAKQSRIA